MNLLKSIFVSAYMTAAMVISMNAVRLMLATGGYLAWGGVVLVYAPFLVVIGRIMLLRDLPRTSARFPTIIILAVAGVSASTWGYVQGASVMAPILAVAGLVLFLVYAWWYSGFGNRHSARIEVGEMLPAFELRNTSSETVSSASLLDKPTVWIFYRGNWCPLCMAQIKEVAGQYRQLDELGARVALVSPQPHKYTVGLAKKHEVSFEFLTDENNRAARELGIAHAFGVPMGMQILGYDSETVLPTVIITDRGGRILWVHETDNYRIRPEPDMFLAVLRERATASSAN